MRLPLWRLRGRFVLFVHPFLSGVVGATAGACPCCYLGRTCDCIGVRCWNRVGGITFPTPSFPPMLARPPWMLMMLSAVVHVRSLNWLYVSLLLFLDASEEEWK